MYIYGVFDAKGVYRFNIGNDIDIEIKKFNLAGCLQVLGRIKALSDARTL